MTNRPSKRLRCPFSLSYFYRITLDTNCHNIVTNCIWKGYVTARMESIAALIGLSISLVLAVWVGRDASRRQTRTAPFLWALGVLLIWMLFFPLYLTKRPLKAGEVRSGGGGWNFMKNLAIAVTVYVPVVVILGLSDIAAQATS